MRVAMNLEELERILLFNEAHGIEVSRIGSSLVPLTPVRIGTGSHPSPQVCSTPWRR
jgi:UV DNA damage endonuclease